ncbi:MAG: hypothetical protein AAB268_06460 [Elusimicrobiota bacterium]
MEPADPVQLAQYLERLLGGLEQTSESLKFEIPYYKADDIQGHYAKKFLASVQEQAADTRKRLEALRLTLPAVKGPEGQ